MKKQIEKYMKRKRREHIWKLIKSNFPLILAALVVITGLITIKILKKVAKKKVKKKIKESIKNAAKTRYQERFYDDEEMTECARKKI